MQLELPLCLSEEKAGISRLSYLRSLYVKLAKIARKIFDSCIGPFGERYLFGRTFACLYHVRKDCYTDCMRNAKSKILLRDDKRLFLQALRYGVAAFGGFAADYGALLLLKEWAGLHYLIAVPIAFVVGLAVNYLIGRWIVFQRSEKKLGQELILFVFISLVALAITEGCMFLFTDLIKVDYRVSRLIAGVVTYLFNFFMRRWVLYATPKGESAEMQ